MWSCIFSPAPANGSPRQERRVLQALAIYGRPVPVDAVRSPCPQLGRPGSVRCSSRLRQLRLAQWDGECFSVPATQEREYLITLVRRDAEAVPARRRRRSCAGRRTTSPANSAIGRNGSLIVRPHLMEIELRLRAGDHEAAFELMGKVDDKYLLAWGASSALVPSLEILLRNKGIPRTLEIDAESMYARALLQQEDYEHAADHLGNALGLASGPERVRRKMRRRIVLREQLSASYLHLGYLRRAKVHSRQACCAAIVQVRTRDTMTALAGLALCLAKEGRFTPALLLLKVARWMLDSVRQAGGPRSGADHARRRGLDPRPARCPRPGREPAARRPRPGPPAPRAKTGRQVPARSRHNSPWTTTTSRVRSPSLRRPRKSVSTPGIVRCAGWRWRSSPSPGSAKATPTPPRAPRTSRDETEGR